MTPLMDPADVEDLMARAGHAAERAKSRPPETFPCSCGGVRWVFEDVEHAEPVRQEDGTLGVHTVQSIAVRPCERCETERYERWLAGEYSSSATAKPRTSSPAPIVSVSDAIDRAEQGGFDQF